MPAKFIEMKYIKDPVKITSPAGLIALLSISLITSELLIVLLIDRISIPHQWIKMLIDFVLLIGLLFPLIFCFIYKPLVNQVNKKQMIETILKKNEERCRNIFENVHDVYYETSIDGTILELSPSIKYLSKGHFSRMDLIGLPVHGLYSNPADRDALLAILSKEGKVSDYEVKLRNKDNTEITCAVSASVTFDNMQNPLKITGSLRDVSARKKTEEMIRKMNEQLLTANSEKDRLFSIISHDLRNPLSTFIGLTEIMAEKGEKLQPSELRKFSDSMNKSASNLYGLLENLLLWSRSKQNSLKIKPTELPLLDTVKDAVSNLISTAERKNIQVLYEINHDLILVADFNYLQTIVRNLTSNALKFTPKNGKVIISAHKKDNGIEISVTDTGIGMSKEILSRLFLIDGKINRHGTEDEPSTGLGLILCKELIEKHGGTINVSSEENMGSKFCFYLSSNT